MLPVRMSALRFRVADAAAELAGQAFLEREIDVDQVRGAGHRRGLDLDVLDERQALQADLRALDRRVRQVRAFELAHLAAEHFIVDAAGAGEVDAPDVDAIAGIDDQRERHLPTLHVELRHRVDLRERIAVEPEPLAHRFGRLGDQALRERLAGLHEDQAAQLALRHPQVARELHVGDAVDLALLHVHGDEDVVLLRADRHLAGSDREVGVAAVHVVRAQCLQVAGQRVLGIAVVLPIPGQPVRRAQLQLAQQLVLGEAGVADDVDLLDARPLALVDVDRDLDLVVRHFLGLGVDRHRVLAAREILLGEVAPDLIQHRLVEALAAGEPDIAQRLLQVLGLDVLVALHLEAFDGRALQHRDDQHAAVATQLHVAEETGRVQRLHRLRDAPSIELVADVDRQVVEDRAFGDALQALDPNVADHEVVVCVARGRSVCCFLRIGAEHERTCDDDRDRGKDSAHRTLDARGMWSVAAFNEYFSRRRARCESSPHCECAVNGARFHALNSRRRSTRSITQALQLVALSVRVLGLSTDSDRPRAGTCRGRCG